MDHTFTHNGIEVHDGLADHMSFDLGSDILLYVEYVVLACDSNLLDTILYRKTFDLDYHSFPFSV